jgi:deazaflavin-dependent oxidoreductase (nitroreductase family)
MAIEIPPAGTKGARKPPSGPLGRLLGRVVMQLHRLTGNQVAGQKLLYLTTVGAKSGQRRTAPVMRFDDGPDTWLIVASRGGTADHPAWFYNLAKQPDQVEIEIDGRRLAVTPRRLTGEERAVAWERIKRERKNFAGYERKTDREIPVIRLTPR